MSPRSSTQDAFNHKRHKNKPDAVSLPPQQLTSPTLAPSSPVLPFSSSPSPSSPSSSSPPSLIHTVGPSSGLSPSVLRVFGPTAAKTASRIDAVTSTFTSLTAHANRGWSNLVSANTSTLPPSAVFNSHLPRHSDGSVSPVYDAFENSGFHARDAGADIPAQASLDLPLTDHALSAPSNQVMWSKWNRFVSPNPEASALAALLIAYESANLQLFVLEGDNLREVLSISSRVLFPDPTLDGQQLVLAGCLRVSPSGGGSELLVLIQQQEPPVTQLVAYSLSQHLVTLRVILQVNKLVAATHHDEKSPKCDITFNDRFVCVAMSSPPSIHALASDTLQYLFDPLTDVGLTPWSIPMSLSGRLLAYATISPGLSSNIISEPPRSTSAKLNEGPRARSSTHSQAAISLGEMRDHMMETSAQVGDVARRVGGGVLSGMRTLGEWSSSYWTGVPSSPTLNNGGDGFSQSAPLASHLSHSVSSSTSSPQLNSANLSRRKKPPAFSDKDSDKHHTEDSPPFHVRVVDLGSSARTVCAFSPSSHPVAAVSLNPSGQLLMTADSLGHAFHVFELQPSGTFGARPSTEALCPVLHRYKLLRGVTSADVVEAQWSQDSQWICVGTRTGTVHVFPINPYGGVPSVENHVSGKVVNAGAIPPLSITVNSLARTARPDYGDDKGKPESTAHGSAASPLEEGRANLYLNADLKVAPPSFTLIDPRLTLIEPSGSMRSLPGNERNGTRTFEILTFEPRSISISLDQMGCSVSSTGKTYMKSNPSARVVEHSAVVSPGAGRSSGLTQMMRRASEGLFSSGSGPKMAGECNRIAVWSGLAARNEIEVKLSLAIHTLPERVRPPSTVHSSSLNISKAEIETYSQSPRVLPASIFLSRQCFFRNFDDKPKGSTGCMEPLLSWIHRTGSKSIQVRQTVTVVGVTNADSHDEASSFDKNLAGALDGLAFDHNDIQSQSPSFRIPSFPQGLRAKSSGWRTSSVPIRMVTEGLGEGIYRAGRELGRGVDMARRRTNGNIGSSKVSGDSTSLSFDGVEDADIFAGVDTHDSALSGSALSPESVPSCIGHGSRSGGSDPSSTETRLTRYSEGDGESRLKDRRLLDDDEHDWDSFTDPEFGGPGVFSRELNQERQSSDEVLAKEREGGDFAEDFTLGIFDEDELSDPGETRTCFTSQSPASNVTASPKGLVYNLRNGTSARSSQLASASSVTAGAPAKEQLKGVRELSPSPSTQSESGVSSTGNGLNSTGTSTQFEGNKETHTFSPSVPGALSTQIPASITKTKKKKPLLADS